MDSTLAFLYVQLEQNLHFAYITTVQKVFKNTGGR